MVSIHLSFHDSLGPHMLCFHYHILLPHLLSSLLSALPPSFPITFSLKSFQSSSVSTVRSLSSTSVLHPHLPISFATHSLPISPSSSSIVLWQRRWFMIDWQERGRQINQEAALELCHNANGVLIECWMALNNSSGFSLQSMHITTMGWQCAFTMKDTSHNAMMLFSVLCFTITGKVGCLCLHIRD